MKSKQHKNYIFTLVLTNVSEDTPNLEDSLFEAGCDDALINYRNGTVFLDFDRQAPSLDYAIMSAIKNVESSSVKARVASVAPEDLVTESEAAERLKKPRQTISLWIQGKRRTAQPFPMPVMKLASRSPLWRWHEIITWLYDQKIIKEKEKVDEAKFIEQINIMLEERDNKALLSVRKKLLKELGQTANQ